MDCDTGIDDAVALLYLLGDPRLALVGVSTVFGNVSAVRAAANTAALLERAGRSRIPIAVGAQAPLSGLFDGGAAVVHGRDGMGDTGLWAVSDSPDSEPASGAADSEPAAQMIVRLAREHAGRLELIATAPLTNLALALRLEPRIATWVRALTIMGGAASVPGNATPVAESNIHRDPEAAAAVLAAPWPITLVPLDVTMDNVVEEDQRRKLLESPDSLAALIGQALAYYFGFYRGVFGRPCAPCHDALAAAIALGDVELALAPTVHVEVDHGYGPSRGQTICDLRGRFRGFPTQAGASCRVVLSLAEPFVPRLLERLLTL